MIFTDRLIIEKAKVEDIHFIMDIEADGYNSQFIWSGTYDEHLNEIEDDNYLLLIIKTKNNNKPVGFILNHLDFESNILELRRIGISEKAKGYGKESIKGLLRYAFNGIDINRVWLDVYTDHKVGIKLYESLGMKIDAILRQSYKRKNEYVDQIVYSILAEEYKSRL